MHDDEPGVKIAIVLAMCKYYACAHISLLKLARARTWARRISIAAINHGMLQKSATTTLENDLHRNVITVIVYSRSGMLGVCLCFGAFRVYLHLVRFFLSFVL